MGYFSRHFRKVSRRIAAAGLVAAAPSVAAPPEPAPTEEPAAPNTVPSWTVSAPNRPVLTVRAETETEARAAAREAWGLSRLPNGTAVNPA